LTGSSLVKLASTVCVPAARLEIVPLVAVPPTTDTVPPRLTPSTANCTVPVAAEGLIVAVNETPAP
jgi:hypothetical protein